LKHIFYENFAPIAHIWIKNFIQVFFKYFVIFLYLRSLTQNFVMVNFRCKLNMLSVNAFGVVVMLWNSFSPLF